MVGTTQAEWKEGMSSQRKKKVRGDLEEDENKSKKLPLNDGSDGMNISMEWVLEEWNDANAGGDPTRPKIYKFIKL